ncbi:MAG: hypothetical protein QM777_25980 [Pseudorhodoferax sp.]
MNAHKKLAGVLCATTVLAGMGLSIFGLATHGGSRLLPWSSDRDLIYFLLFVGAAAWLFGRSSRGGKLPVAALLFVGFATLAGQLWALLVSLVFALSCYLLGGFVLRCLRCESVADKHVSRWLLGAGSYGLLIGGLAHLPVNYPALYAALVAAPLWIRRRELAQLARAAPAFWRQANADTQSPSIARGMLLALALVHFVYALMPELGFDALTLHLLVPSQLLHRHQWGFDPTLYAMALIPMLADWIFSAGYLLGGETASRLINLSFSFLLAWQSQCLAVWLGAHQRWARLVPVLLLSTPLLFTETNSLHVEAIWSCFVVAGAVALLRLVLDRDTQPAQLILAALLLGLAANAKAITLLFLPPLALSSAVAWRRMFSVVRQRSFVYAFVVFAVVAAIPYATAYVIAQNPVFPFYNGVFQSPYYPAQNFNNVLYNSGLGWATPYLALFDAGKYMEATTGGAGFEWLVLFPAAVLAALWSRSRRMLALLVLVVLATFLVFRSQSYLRYILPVYAIGAALMLAALSGFAVSARISACLRVAFTTVLGLNLMFFCSATWTYREFPLALLLNGQYRDYYLEQRSPVRLAVEAVNQVNLRNKPVAFFTREAYGAGLHADALYPSWYNHEFFEKARSIRSEKDVAGVLADYGVDYFIVSSEWGGEQLQKLLESSSNEIVRIGRISVRRLREEARFSTELLKDPGISGAADWIIGAGAIQAPSGGVSVNANNSVAQGLPVQPGRLYRNEVTARCAGPMTQGRVQVNWQDAKGEFINTDIKVFDCTDELQTYRQYVVSPRNAAAAIVYGGSNTDGFIFLSEISFR